MRNRLYITAIIVFAAAARLYFFVGHIFSDDAYYSYLSYSFYKGDFPGHYVGYPVFLLRTGQIGLTALSYSVFGINILATAVFPLIFSVLGIILVYHFTSLITKNKSTALIAAFLAAFFPTDVVFSTMCFPDLINAFFINLGLFLLWKAWESKQIYLTLFSGISLFISFLFKENLYYIVILLIILGLYLFVKKQPGFKYVLAVLSVVFVCILGESIWYAANQGQFFFRLNVVRANYRYSYYDFFPYTVYKDVGHSIGILPALIYQIFIINLKSVFLRRFYLFVPLIALVSALLNLRKRRDFLLSFWFLGLTILLTAFTTSVMMYKPLDLHRSWYIYPLILPAVILSSILIAKFKALVKYLFIILYVIFSFVMCNQYEIYFNTVNREAFEKFVERNADKNIYADFFTKYSIDLLLNYRNEKNRKIISGNTFDFNELKKGALVVYDKNHIDELKLQKHILPKFGELNSAEFKLIGSFGEFKVYEKIL